MKKIIFQRPPKDYMNNQISFNGTSFQFIKKNVMIFHKLVTNMKYPFFMVQNTIHKRGSSSLITYTTRAEKQQWEVMFPLMADSKKLLPYIIFKRKRIPKGIKFKT